MRVPFIISLLLACLVFVGCSQSGDFNGFFVGEIAKYGLYPKAGITVSKLYARWTIQKDSYGYQIYVRGQPFTAVCGVVRQVFGAPKVSVKSDANGHPHQVYAMTDMSLAVECTGRTDDVEIHVIKLPSPW